MADRPKPPPIVPGIPGAELPPPRPRQQTIPESPAPAPQSVEDAPGSATLESADARVVPRERPAAWPPARIPSPPGGTPAQTVPVSEAERLLYAERARNQELQEELAKRPPRTPSEPPVSLSRDGLRIPTRTLKRLAPWLLTAAVSGGGGYLTRERLLDALGIVSEAKLETERAARRDVERRLAEETAARTQAEADAVERDRQLAAWLATVLPPLGVRVILPPGVTPPPAPTMQPSPLVERIGPGAASPIQPAPLPMPPAAPRPRN